MKYLIMYHHPCSDGYAAACAVFERWVDNDNTEYRGASYPYLETDPSKIEISADCTDIYFLDICPKAHVLDYLLNHPNELTITVLDHHAGGKDTLSVYPYHPRLRFIMADDKLSGATLAWVLQPHYEQLTKLTEMDVFAEPYQKTYQLGTAWDEESRVRKTVSIFTNLNMEFQPWTDGMPDMWRLIGVRDLWLTDDPQLKAQADALNSYMRYSKVVEEPPQNLGDWLYGEGGLSKVLDKAMVIDEVYVKLAAEAIKTATRTYYQQPDGQVVKVMVGSCPDSLGSIYGQIGYTQEPIPTIVIAVFQNFLKDQWSLSLRSKGIPCKGIAEWFGGGGHDYAAGARWTHPGIVQSCNLSDLAGFWHDVDRYAESRGWVKVELGAGGKFVDVNAANSSVVEKK